MVFSTFSRTLLRVALAASAALAGAQAGTFNFSYMSSTGVLSGQLTGTLQADLNTVVVTSVLSPAFDGVPSPALPIFTSVTTRLGGPAVPVVSLNGLVMDLYNFYIDANVLNNVGFSFLPANIYGEMYYLSTSFFGGNFEPFAPSNWSLTPAAVAAVPEPGGLVLVATALAALAIVAARRT